MFVNNKPAFRSILFNVLLFIFFRIVTTHIQYASIHSTELNWMSGHFANCLGNDFCICADRQTKIVEIHLLNLQPQLKGFVICNRTFIWIKSRIKTKKNTLKISHFKYWTYDTVNLSILNYWKFSKTSIIFYFCVQYTRILHWLFFPSLEWAKYCLCNSVLQIFYSPFS